MATEGATYIAQLDPSRPSNTQDPAGEGDDHLRQEKFVLQQTFAGGTYQSAPDVYDTAVTVGPRFLNALPATLTALDDDYVSLTTPQNVPAEHTFDAGLKIAQGTNIQSDNNEQVIGVGPSDEVVVGNGAAVTIQDSSGEPTVNDGVTASPILTVKNIADLLFPVGSIYCAASGFVNPNNIFPGTTWTRSGLGRFVVQIGTGTDVNGLTRTYAAGQDSFGKYKVPLTQTEMPAHSHTLPAKDYDDIIAGAGVHYFEGRPVSGQYTGTTGGASGVTQPHENSPPAYGVYLWSRTA